MKVLGVFLKVIAIIVMVVGTIICALVAISAGVAEAFFFMALAELCVLIVGFTILGLGSACCKISALEKRVAELERKTKTSVFVPAPAAASTPAASIEANDVSVPEAAPAEKQNNLPPIEVVDTMAKPKKKSKVWIPIVIVVLVVIIAAAFILSVPSSNEQSADPAELTVEEVYALLLNYAANGEYDEVGSLPYACPELPEYEDAQQYLSYCEAMEAYAQGGLGYAYSILRTVPHILDAQSAMAAIDEKISSLNGCYVEDNGQGANLHIVIRDGLVASAIIGYYDEVQTFDYTDEDFDSQLYLSHFNDGTEFLGIAWNSAYTDAEDIKYAISTFDDTSDIMVIAMEGQEFKDFNGLYSRTGDVEPWEPDDGCTDLSLGESLSTDFVTMSFDDYIVAADVKHSVTTGYVTRITGPEPLAGQKYICLTGTIQNTSTSPLPVYDFFIGNFELDGYNYEVSANDIDILDGEGQTKSEIDPLMVYNYRLYVAIPDALADSYSSCNFSFGFFDGFENQELAYIRSFEENPISLCPYQYDVTLK